MPAKRRRRFPLSRFIAPTATLMILGYFGFHAFNGQYGIRAHMVMKKRIETLETRLHARTMVRNRLESRVNLLREGQMERDIVDEFARRQLNLVREDEVVILYPQR